MNKVDHLRELLKSNGSSDEEIEHIIGMKTEDQKKESRKEIRAWITLGISIIAIVISIIALTK